MKMKEHAVGTALRLTGGRLIEKRKGERREKIEDRRERGG
jgi:hypothetical protein